MATVFVPLLLLLLKANSDQRDLAATSARQQATAVVANVVAAHEQQLQTAVGHRVA